MTEGVRFQRLKPILPWAGVVLVLVILLPMGTFFANRAKNPAASAQTRGWSEVRSGGEPFVTTAIASLKVGNGPDEVALSQDSDGRKLSTFEMVAPAPDDSSYWIADHPSNAPAGARVRRFDRSGRLRESFHTPSGTTMFTPGFKQDLWVILSSGSTRVETLLHYSASGKLIGRYPLIEGLLTRAVYPRPDGSVWVLSEEWLMDSETFKPSYGGTLVPVLSAGGKVVEDPTAGATEGTFIGYDGRIYSMTSDPATNSVNYPPFHVSVKDPQTGKTQRFDTAGGVRPYMADAQGRIYAEPLRPASPDTPGIAILGDQSITPIDVQVYRGPKQIADLLVAYPPSSGGWSPTVWPSASGAVYSARWEQGRLSIQRSAPASAAVGTPTANEKPARAQARVLVPMEAPFSGDPYLAIDDAQRDVWRMVYSGLVSWDQSLTAIPDLAESIPAPGKGVSADGRTITWRIAAGRTWHDGTPVTADDVAATWAYLRKPSLLTHGKPFPGFEYIESVKASGSDVIVRLSQPFGAAPEAFFPFVLPAHVIEDGASTSNGGLFAAPVGSGPFRVARWERDGRMMLVAHTDAANRPRLKRLDVQFMARTGLVDDFMASPVPTLATWLLPKHRETLDRDAFGSVVSVDTGRWVGFVFNAARGVTTAPAVRGAVRAVYPYATGIAVNGPAHPATATVGPFGGARARIPAERLRSDPATAPGAELLQRAGWRFSGKHKDVRTKDGKKLRVILSIAARTGYPHEVPSEVFDSAVARMRSIGINADWAQSTAGFYFAPSDGGYLTSSRHMVATGAFRTFPDPAWGSIFDPADEPGWDRPWGIAVTGTHDPQLRDLHARARRSYDAQERQQLGRRIAQRVEELDLAVWEYPEQRYCGQVGLKGYRPAPYPAGDFWNVAQWEVEKAR